MGLNIRERLDITATGGKLYPFINAIRRSDIVCTKQRCKGEKFYCRIYRADQQKLQRIAESCGVSIESKSSHTLLGALRPYRLRLGFLLGTLTCIFILFLYSNTVSTVEVRGNEEVSSGVILSVLKHEGLKPGKWITDIDYESCERKLRLYIPQLAWAAIRHEGSRIVVEVHEATPKTEMLHERVPCNIISMYDAQITDVRVYNGHLERLIGDGVKKGELLVSGVLEDDKGGVFYHHAIASIKGVYQKEAELTEYFSVPKTEKTGKSRTKRFFRLFHLEIPLNFGTHHFSECIETVTDIPYRFLGKTLPFGIMRRTYTETSTKTVTRTEEETQLALNSAIVRYEKNFLSDVKILDRSISYSKHDDGLSCRIFYILEGEIGRTADIFVK